MNIQNDKAEMAVINLAGIAAAAASEIPRIIRDGIEREILGKPSFIADGMPESTPGQIGQAAARSACRQYAAGNSGLTGQAAANAETACRPYLNDIYPPTGPSVKTPFNGGQCPGVNYRVSWSWSAGSFNSGPQTADRTGPLSFDRAGTGSLDCGPGGGNYNVLTLREGTGNNPVSIYAGCGAQLNSLTVARLDGQPDNCGDPEPEVTQPTANPDTQPPPFRFNPNPLIDLPIDVTINPDGTIGVDIGTGPITVDAFNGDGGGGGDGAGGGGGGAPPGDVGSPGGGQATGDGGESEGEAPPGQVLTGLRVVITAFPPSRTLLENAVYRGAYYAYMGVPGLLDLDPAGAATALDQFIFAEKDNLTAWRVRTNRGYNATVTPYYRTPD